MITVGTQPYYHIDLKDEPEVLKSSSENTPPKSSRSCNKITAGTQQDYHTDFNKATFSNNISSPLIHKKSLTRQKRSIIGYNYEAEKSLDLIDENFS
ncbi:hypothetical protein O181_022341 [Austropuccinia psidii MF-1]|uniref:Uncharacterized protein n=1 Tax=Austropuccinia psidii MF-1 TaxID=1389203 RepID=A0A9Q3CCN8_9BASI|nr:hypothetical protein [Austropuccinia psidii MF-1]